MKIVFAGTPEFAAQFLADLIDQKCTPVDVWTQPDRPRKRGRKPTPSPVKAIAIKHSLDVFQPERIGPQAIERLRHLQPDIVIVVAFGQILPAELLSIPRFGCINVHTSLLPRWRGAAPVQRAIGAGDELTGVSIMQMDEGLDTGPIIAAGECTIESDDTSATLMQKLQHKGSELLTSTLELIATGAASSIPQSHQGVCYAHKITRQEAAIDWTESAIAIERKIRMLNPDPVAYSLLDELRVRVWQASPLPAAEPKARLPGEILMLKPDGLYVACGEGMLRITQLQLPLGKGKVIQASDAYNSRRELFVAGRCFRQAAVA